MERGERKCDLSPDTRVAWWELSACREGLTCESRGCGGEVVTAGDTTWGRAREGEAPWPFHSSCPSLQQSLSVTEITWKPDVKRAWKLKVPCHWGVSRLYQWKGRLRFERRWRRQVLKFLIVENALVVVLEAMGKPGEEIDLGGEILSLFLAMVILKIQQSYMCEVV